MPSSPDPLAAPARRLFAVSLLAFTIAFLVSTLVHEGAHAATARALGLHPVLHHNYVDTADHEEADSPAARLWVPATGPLASLVLGLACLAWLRRREAGSDTSLVVLWLGVQGLIVFFGYLMMGPLFAYGDTGKVYAELGVPGAARWLLAGAGLGALIVSLRAVTPEFARHVFRAPGGLDRPRRAVANALIAWPVLVGAVVTSVLSLPVPTFLSLLHPATSPFAVFVCYGRLRRGREPLPEGVAYPDGVPWALVLTLAVLLLVSRGLVAGLAL